MTSILAESPADEWVIEHFRAELAALPEIVEVNRRPRPKRWMSASALDTHAELPIVPILAPVIRRLPVPHWHAEAACRGVAYEAFFGIDNPVKQPSLTHETLRSTRVMCAQCPVRRKCFVASMKQRESHGIWAGVSGRQRRRVFDVLDDMVAEEQELAIERLADEWLK